VSGRGLARGPACLTQALGIGRAHDGDDLTAGGALGLEPGVPPSSVSTGPRVGVSRAPDVRWRFWATGDETVSAYRRSARA
jgi:DNA-3-methyladenine glycosylase